MNTKKICKTIDEDKAMFDEDIDDDMRHMLEDEVKELSARKEVLEGEFPILLLPKDPMIVKTLSWKFVVV